MTSQVQSTTKGRPSLVINLSRSAESCDSNLIRILSWNIGGIDDQALSVRSFAVYQVILNQAPDVVFLQELVPEGWQVIKDIAAYTVKASAILTAKLNENIAQTVPRYGVVFGPRKNRAYCCAILLRLDVCELIGRKTIPFPMSEKGRSLLLVRARIRGVDFTLLTTHLESLLITTEERRRQLRLALMTVKKAPASQCVLLGGDLNVRDWELDDVGGIPTGVVDVWQAAGSDPNHQYTWDTEKNDNIVTRAWTARCRFDRFMFRPPTVKGCSVVQPTLFRTVGRTRIASCGRFPSDHWGILANFSFHSHIPAVPRFLAQSLPAKSSKRPVEEAICEPLGERLQ